MKRLVSIDCLRGLAIIGVVFAHALIFNNDVTGINMESNWFTNLLLYFMTWAGEFAIISGIGNTISSYGQFRAGKITPKKVLVNNVITGVVTIFINYIYLDIFSPGYVVPPTVSIGLLPGLLRTGTVIISSPERLLFTTALMMIGWSSIFTGIFLFLLIRNGGADKSKRNYLVLGTVATISILIFPVLQDVLRPFMVGPLTVTNFLGALIVSWMVGPMDPAFPYLGFALYGVIFGMLIVDGAKRRTMLGYGYGVGAIYSVIGFIYIAMEGFNAPAYDTPPLPLLISILGPMLLLTTFSIHVVDFSSERAKKWIIKHSVGVRAFGLVSLSVFTLEGSFSAIIRLIVNIIYPGFTYDVGFVFLIFSPLVLILWWVIVRLWARSHFKGSFEWVIIHGIGKLTGKQTKRLDADYILRTDEAYFDRPKDVENLPAEAANVGSDAE